MFQAGTLEKSDVLVTLEQSINTGIEIVVHSKVEKIFGKQIRQQVLDILQQYKINNIKVTLEDQGALDFILRARLKTAIRRMRGTL